MFEERTIYKAKILDILEDKQKISHGAVSSPEIINLILGDKMKQTQRAQFSSDFHVSYLFEKLLSSPPR